MLGFHFIAFGFRSVRVSSINYSFFKNADKFIISEIIFAEIRGFITLSAVESLQIVSMWI
ncbi:hypothetical protein Hanom_Chr07g00585761 [Helianthus anomalus]